MARTKHQDDGLRPMEPGWLEHENEKRVQRRLTHERCVLMESALRRVGFAPNTIYWDVAVLCAKLSDGWNPVQRELGRLADDNDIGCRSSDPTNRKRAVRRALHELQEFGLLQWHTEAGEPRRRTRPSSLVTVIIDPRNLHQAVESEIGTTAGQRPDREADNGGTTAGQRPDREADNGGTTAGQNEKHSLYVFPIPIPFNPSSPSLAESSSETTTTKEEISIEEGDPEIDQAIDASGCECKRLVIREAERFGVRREELLEACYVCRYTPSLNGGALLAWIRNGGWPISGVRSAESLRRLRSEAADRIRRDVRLEAAESGKDPPEWVIAAVSAKRLLAKNFADQLTSDEEQSYQRYNAK